MMDEGEQLRNIIKWRTKRKLNKTTRLGDVVKQFMENRVSPRQARFEAIAEVWSRLLPAEVHNHCEIADISGGQLKVLVDSPSYVYDLRLCSPELLEELQQQCPRARIKKIKFTIG